MAEFRFPIYRANETNLRRQIMAALEYIGWWPVIKTEVEAGESVEVPASTQMLVYNAFTVTGTIDVEGQLVIL